MTGHEALKGALMFKNILISVDDSSCSEQAGTYGLELAKRFGARVLVTHIVAELPKLYSDTNWAKEMLEQGKQLLATWKQKAEAENFLLETSVVASQDIALGIVSAAQENACDLIVMGTHGRKGLAHAFLGSVAERVTRLTTLPVLLVRETKVGQTKVGQTKVGQTKVPEAKPAITPSFERILVAVDGSDASRKALRYADDLAQAAQAELHLLHVIPDLPAPLIDPIGLGGAAATLNYKGTLKHLEQEARIIMEVSRAEVDTQTTVFHTARAQREGIAEVITSYAKAQGCSFIVMGTHGRSGFDRLLLGSVAEGVAHTTPVPLLLIRHVSKTKGGFAQTVRAEPALS
jgi:nucleotide-binding universal stress UspA family protein